jgi:hypothetical protein
MAFHSTFSISKMFVGFCVMISFSSCFTRQILSNATSKDYLRHELVDVKQTNLDSGNLYICYRARNVYDKADSLYHFSFPLDAVLQKFLQEGAVTQVSSFQRNDQLIPYRINAVEPESAEFKRYGFGFSLELPNSIIQKGEILQHKTDTITALLVQDKNLFPLIMTKQEMIDEDTQMPLAFQKISIIYFLKNKLNNKEYGYVAISFDDLTKVHGKDGWLIPFAIIADIITSPIQIITGNLTK